MSLTNPFALALLVLALPIALLYLVRVRPRELVVSADQFWEQVFAEQSLRTSWNRIRNLASLLVQCLLLGLLAFAVAEPFWSSEALEASRVILVIDDSASMTARDGATSRLESAKQAASRVIAGLRAGDEAAIVVSGAERRVALGLTSDRRALQHALQAVAPSQCPTQLARSVDLARLLLAGHARGRVEVFTDGCGEGVASLAGLPDVVVHRVGSPLDNLAITRFQARRSLDDVASYQVFIEVTNFAATAVDTQLELLRDGVTVDVLPLALNPGATWRKVLAKTGAEGGRLEARIDRADGLELDNQAWAIVPRRDPLPAALVDAGGQFDDLYLEKVLEANPLVQQPVALATSASLPTASGTSSVRIYHHRIPERLPPGPSVVIHPAGSCDLWELGGPVVDLLVGSQDAKSPLMAYVKLENVVLTEARSLQLKAKGNVVAAFVGGEPLVVAIDRPEGRVVVLTASLDDPADLPLRTAFPILMGNALAWVDPRRVELQESTPTGQPVTLRGLPSGARLWTPDGREAPCSAVADTFVAGPLDQRGVWRVAPRADAEPIAELACNLASATESDLRPDPGLPAPGVSGSVPGSRRALASLGPPWYLLIVAAFGLVVLEWRLYQRRWLS